MPCCVCGVCAAGVWAAAPRSRSVSMRRVLQQLASRGTQAANGSEMHLDLERIVDRISEYTFGFRGAHHDDQLYLSEFVAFKARELLFNIDLDVEARNTVVVQAAKLQSCKTAASKKPQSSVNTRREWNSKRVVPVTMASETRRKQNRSAFV